MTSRVNAALVRYGRGHLYVDVGGPGNRIETYIEMGHVDDADAAEGLARAYLAEASTPTTTYAATAEKRSIDTVPGLGLRLGDAVAGQPLVAPAYSLADHGGAIVTYGTGDARQVKLDGLDRQMQRAGSGMTSELAAPKLSDSELGRGEPAVPDPWSFSGEDDDDSLSPVWKVPHPYAFSWVDLVVGEPGWATTRVHVLVGTGSTYQVLAVLTLAGGVDRVVTTVGKQVAPPQRVRVRVVQSGGARDLTITPVGAFA